MLEKWKQKAVKMNLKRAVIIFIITAAALICVCSAAAYINFKDRINQWKTDIEASEENKSEENISEENILKENKIKENADGNVKEIAEENEEENIEENTAEKEAYSTLCRKNYKKEFLKDKKEIEIDRLWEELTLSGGDIAIIVICGIIGIILLIWYWLLCIIWAYRKSVRMGVNSTPWVIAALFFNLASIAVLYLFAAIKGTCRNCGRIKTGKYCVRCGKPFKRECPYCGHTVDIKADYCGNCGEKLNQGKE